MKTKLVVLAPTVGMLSWEGIDNRSEADARYKTGVFKPEVERRTPFNTVVNSVGKN